MKKLQKKKLIDSVINSGMYKHTSIKKDFLLFSKLIFKYGETSVLMDYFKCSRSKVSKLRNGLQNYSKNDLEKLNELFISYKYYIKDYNYFLF